MGLVMTFKMSDQGAGHAKLHICFKMRIIIGIDLADHSFEARLIDQSVNMRGAEGMAILRGEQLADNPRGGHGIASGLDGAKPETPLVIGGEGTT